jgi:hypothetical protein
MNKVLMVVTSVGRMEANGAPTGAWLEELAASYYVFVDAGCDVTLASPRGGVAPLDPLSLERHGLRPAGTRFRADAAATAKLANTVPLEELRAAEFAAVYCVGGAGDGVGFSRRHHACCNRRSVARAGAAGRGRLSRRARTHGRTYERRSTDRRATRCDRYLERGRDADRLRQARARVAGDSFTRARRPLQLRGAAGGTRDGRPERVDRTEPGVRRDRLRTRCSRN